MGKNNRKNHCDNWTTMSSPMAHNAKESLRQLYRVRNFESLPFPISLQWRHNGRDGVSYQQPCDCLLSRIFRHRSKKTSSNWNIFLVTDLLWGEFTSHWLFPSQRPVTPKMFPFNDVIMCVDKRDERNNTDQYHHRNKFYTLSISVLFFDSIRN